MQLNKFTQPIIILGTAIVLLLLAKLVPEETTVFGLEIKSVDMLSDLREEESFDDFNFDNYFEEDSSQSDTDSTADNSESSLINSTKVNKAGFIASDMLYSFLNAELNKIGEHGSGLVTTRNEKITGNVSQMNHFVNALKRSKTQQVRIAHYGDSGIEGDLVSADLRETLQREFGGGGVGFLPIVTEGINYRQSIGFSYSDSWNTFSINTRNPDRLPVGINGEVFVNNGSAWFEFETNSRFRHSRNFDVVKIYYSDATSGTISVIIDGGSKKTERLLPGSGIKELTISAKNSKSVRVEVPASTKAYFYGVSLESGNGVYVDNFPFRGNSGVDLEDISINNLQEFNRYLDYDLIIFQFGLNALSARMGNYKRYERKMTQVVEHFKKAFPNTSFVLIGAQDRSVKKGSGFESDPSLAKLIQAQINIARDTKIAFWNLFDAMGGPNSMVDWVESNPPLAYKDYIHFNEAGVKKVAELFGDALKELK